MLGLLEHQGPPPPGRGPIIDLSAHWLWIRACIDPFGSRSQLVQDLRQISGSPLEEPALRQVGYAAWLLDESALAITLLHDAMQRRQAPGVQGTSGLGLTSLGWAYVDMGRWDEAQEVAAEAAGLAEAKQMEPVSASAELIAATVLAMRGDSGAARMHADWALASADPAECGLVAARARQALGIAALEQLIGRARGILAVPGGAEAHFDKALSGPLGNQWPFERAQLRLDYAEWLRRQRRINDAKPVLTEALGTFRRLRARSWAQRAEAELRACGVAVADRPGEPDVLEELTPQQRHIVRLASEGLSNREIGDRLFLSPRTVSTHLYRSYPKLGVARRDQLRDVIARAGSLRNHGRALLAVDFDRCACLGVPASA